MLPWTMKDGLHLKRNAVSARARRSVTALSPGELPVPEECEIPQTQQSSALPSSRPPTPLLCGEDIKPTPVTGQCRPTTGIPSVVGILPRSVRCSLGSTPDLRRFIAAHSTDGTDGHESRSRPVMYPDSFQQTEQREELVLEI